MTTVNGLVERVSTQLFDQWPGDTYARWAAADLINYLNQAEEITVFLKPQSYVVTAVYQLVAGTRQSLPDGSATFLSPAAATHPAAIELVSVNRNMGADGATAGASIFPMDGKEMNDLFPAWRSATAAGVVVHSMFNKNDRTVFEVYPAQPATAHWIEVVYSAVPTAAIAGGSINLGGEYVPALETYMLYQAHSMDAQNSQFSATRAAMLWGKYLSLIGRKDLIEKNLPTTRGSEHGGSNQ